MTAQHLATTEQATAITVAVVRDVSGFRALEDDWRRLCAASPATTPFQSWDWLFSWWEVYGRRGALHLLTAYDGDQLVGALPLMVTSPGVLRFVGTGLSDHLDAVVHPAYTTAVVDAWIAALAGHRLLDLQEVRPTAVSWALYQRWPGRKAQHHQSTCAEIDVAPLEQLLARWGPNTRKATRTALNRTTKKGYRQVRATADEIGARADELVALHRKAWEGRAITPAHLEPEFAQFVRTVCGRLAVHDAVELLYLEAPPDAAEPMQLYNLMLVGSEYVGGWLSGYNEALRRRVRIAALENAHAVEAAARRGLPVMSMLRGLEDGKPEMSDRTLANHRLLLAGTGAAAVGTWLRMHLSAAAKVRLKRWAQHSRLGADVTAVLRTVRERFRR